MAKEEIRVNMQVDRRALDQWKRDTTFMERVAGDPFVLRRNEDETGISGTGDVAWGFQFPDGVCVLRWRSEHASTAVYDSIEQLVAIHGHGGKTQVVWL